MPAINFQSQFAPMVESGAKRQTIRAKRKNPIVAGDKLFLYTGMRTKKCRKLKEVECIAVFDILIEPTQCTIGGVKMVWDIDYLDKFAKNDGFKDWERLIKWFATHHALPFEGQLINW